MNKQGNQTGELDQEADRNGPVIAMTFDAAGKVTLTSDGKPYNLKKFVANLDHVARSTPELDA